MTGKKIFAGFYNPRVLLRIRIILLSVLALIIGFLTPHIFRKFTIIPPHYGESLLFLLDFIFIIGFVGVYYRDLKKLEIKEKRSQTLLSDTFKHLGLANRRVEVMKNFINAYQEAGQVGKREIINQLFTLIMVSLLRSPLGILRVIDRESGRTLTEWRYRQSETRRKLAFSNKSALGCGCPQDKQVRYLLSATLNGENTVCVIGYLAGEEGEEARILVTTLLNQIYLLVTAFRLHQGSRQRRSLKETRLNPHTSGSNP